MINIEPSINRRPTWLPRVEFLKGAALGLIRRRRNGSADLKTCRQLLPVAAPERRKALRKDLYKHRMLDETVDGKLIFLVRYAANSPVAREIGRLREIAFRAVDEGTGRERDLDDFDRHYQHIVLWDDNDREIVGAYRVADAGAMLKSRGTGGLYTGSLFRFEPAMHQYLDRGLELGRSFVQPRYWGRRSLDYLWYGIGAYLRIHPDIRYLFGPVTLSGSLSAEALDLLVRFYRTYFPGDTDLAQANQPYRSPDPPTLSFSGKDYQREFILLKARLQALGTAVPALYKQYTELCEPGGARFLDFGIDQDFADCVDGLVLIDTRLIKRRKWERYVGGRRVEGILRAA